jgi:hypothetical protein
MPSYTPNAGDFDDGTEAIYDRTYKVLEQHTWLDLDGDGYQEPYIVTVDEDSTRLLRLVPRIDDYASVIELQDEKVVPIKLAAECYFADIHFMPDPEGNFWSIGLAHMIGGTNAAVNELMNNMLNVAVLATKQGGILAGGAKNLAGKQRMDSTKWNVAAGVNGDDIRKAIVPFDIKDPSPVIKDLTMLLIETGEKMGTLSEALSGEMPSREMPAQTMLMLIEQSLKNSQAVYRRIHSGLTKELQIMIRLLLQDGNQEHYQMVLDDPEANLAQDMDLASMDLGYHTDSSTSSVSEQLMKLKAFGELAAAAPDNPFLNQKEFLLRGAKLVDISDSERLLQDPPPPQPDPMVEVAQQQLQVEAKKNEDSHQAKLYQLEIDAHNAVATIEQKRADSASKLSTATPQGLNKESMLYQEMYQMAEQDIEAEHDPEHEMMHNPQVPGPDNG